MYYLHCSPEYINNITDINEYVTIDKQMELISEFDIALSGLK